MSVTIEGYAECTLADPPPAKWKLNIARGARGREWGCVCVLEPGRGAKGGESSAIPNPSKTKKSAVGLSLDESRPQRGRPQTARETVTRMGRNRGTPVRWRNAP